jgi:hypothetical protein
VVVFEVMLGCPFWDSRAAGRGRGVVRREIVRFVVKRLAPADFRSGRLSRTSLSGLWRLAPISQIQNSTGAAQRETGRKYRKGIVQVGMKSEGLTSGTQGSGARRSHFEIGGDKLCSRHLSGNVPVYGSRHNARRRS